MLRPLQLTDAQALSLINETALGYAFSVAQTAQQLDKLLADPQHFFIGYAADQSGDLLGYVHAQQYESLYSEPGLNVLALAVLPAAQGRGIGRQLMVALEDLAHQSGFAFIRLNSASHRLEAHKFYLRIGYDGDKTQLRFIKLFEEENDD